MDKTQLRTRFGHKVRAFRKNRKMTQEELADKLGITPPTLSGIERGKSFPSYGVLQKLPLVLDVEIIHFFNFDEEIGNSNEKILLKINECFSFLDDEQKQSIVDFSGYLVKKTL